MKRRREGNPKAGKQVGFPEQKKVQGGAVERQDLRQKVGTLKKKKKKRRGGWSTEEGPQNGGVPWRKAKKDQEETNAEKTVSGFKEAPPPVAAREWEGGSLRGKKRGERVRRVCPAQFLPGSCTGNGLNRTDPKRGTRRGTKEVAEENAKKKLAITQRVCLTSLAGWEGNKKKKRRRKRVEWRGTGESWNVCFGKGCPSSYREGVTRKARRVH